MVIIMETDSGKILKSSCGQTYGEEVLSAEWADVPHIGAHVATTHLQPVLPATQSHQRAPEDVQHFMAGFYLAEGLKGRT